MTHPADDTRFLAAFATAPPDAQRRLLDASALDDTEEAVLREALGDSEDAVSCLAARMLDDWTRLTAAERTAGLLVLAERLATERGA